MIRYGEKDWTKLPCQVFVSPGYGEGLHRLVIVPKEGWPVTFAAAPHMPGNDEYLFQVMVDGQEEARVCFHFVGPEIKEIATLNLLPGKRVQVIITKRTFSTDTEYGIDVIVDQYWKKIFIGD